MDTALFTAIITGLLLLFLVLGLPVAFSLGGIAVLGVVYIWGAKGMYMVAQTAYSEGTNSILTAVPLFILMANVLRTSRPG